MKQTKTTRAIAAEHRTSSPPAARTIAARAAKVAQANRLAAAAAAARAMHVSDDVAAPEAIAALRRGALA